jgi:hypothetical protein
MDVCLRSQTFGSILHRLEPPPICTCKSPCELTQIFYSFRLQKKLILVIHAILVSECMDVCLRSQPFGSILYRLEPLLYLQITL